MSDTLVLDRIQNSLTRLRLPRMGEILESVMQAAAVSYTHLTLPTNREV